MPVVDINQVSKSFGPNKAVVDVSFTVDQGEIFGLLGPNGAGKTTIIRMLLDLFKPDQGDIAVFGGAMNEAKQNLIGYMPEERGLYQDVPLERCLTYLASLKGLATATIRARLDHYLHQFELADHRRKKVKELSKGMQQKAQLIATLIHKPELIIIDEPFTGLDPVNTKLVKNHLRDLHEQGACIIMSTHQMHQVEELCDRILLLDQGRAVLYGRLTELRRRFSGHAVLARTDHSLTELAGVTEIERHNGTYKLFLDDQTTPQAVLQTLVTQGIDLEYFEIAIPTLDEIFIQTVQQEPTV